jgi:thiosulfate/3-mercaptopyruvate sulfurtransferase
MVLILLAVGVPFLLLGVGRLAAQKSSQHPADPWTAAQIVQPADLVAELGNAKSANRPVVACVGFRTLYEGAHVPGAVFHGAASTATGLEDLKKWAQGLPRSANLVIYCGCCPLAHCPNIRPAFEALRDMGFSHLRVLFLPNDFATDWVAKGYPTERGR